MRETRSLSEAKKYTQKDIKEYVRLGKATDITNWSFEKINDLLKERSLELVGSSFGINGMNGGLYRDVDTGELFAVCARSSTLLQMPY